MANQMLHRRRLIAIICLAVILLAALAPATSSAHYTFLLLVDPLFALVLAGASSLPEPIDTYRSPVLTIAGSRPPPRL
jgi:hypothetical protein